MERIPQRNARRRRRGPGARAHHASVAAAILAATLTGCSTLERSRDIGNPSVDGATLAVQVCSNCHGIDGNSTSPNFPRLAGQPERYIVVELSEFRSHERGDPAGFEYMWGLSRKLTDAQIAAIAAYFHRQTPQPNPAGPGREAAAGKAVLESGVPDTQVPACTTCHGEHAEGHDEYPRLAGQHADYLVKQLVVFQRTDQRPAGAVMKVIAHGLKPEQITAVADYLQGLTTN
jgi:cytochrome c553